MFDVNKERSKQSLFQGEQILSSTEAFVPAE